MPTTAFLCQRSLDHGEAVYRVVEASEGARALIGLGADEVVRRGHESPIVAALCELLEAAWRRGRIEERTLPFEPVPLSALAFAVNLEKVACHVGTERALTASKSRQSFLHKVIDTVPGFVCVKDSESRFLLANRSVAEAYGMLPSELIGKSDADLNTSQDEVAAFNRDDREVIESREPKLILAERITDAQGRQRWLSTVKVPLIEDDGSCGSLLAVATDITAIKLAEEQAASLQQRIQQTQKLESLGILAGGIAHDFNNLLVGMLGNAELALNEMSAASVGRQQVHSIQQAAKHAADLTNQLLAYSGKGKFVVECLDLRELVRDMAHLLEVSISKKAVLRYDFSDALPAVEADVAQIRQVVMNLITNASEAIGDRQGVITLATGILDIDERYLLGTVPGEEIQAGHYAYLEVSDTGCGMDEETRGRMFDPFFTTKFTGRGLGLAAVHGIVRSHGGAIKVYSEPGRGTSIKLMLPLCCTLQRARTSTGTNMETMDKLVGNALVVDDDPTVRRVAAQMLETFGLTVLTAAGGAEAVRIAADPEVELDVVLLDMTMPEMSGEETFGALRRLRPELKVVLSSGYNEQDATSRFAGKGLAGFVQKPYTLAELERAVMYVLRPR